MLKSAIIARGSGYADDTTFEPFEVLRHPLPEREMRILGSDNGKPGTGVCYRAYDVKLAVRRTGESERRRDRKSTFYILMHHGAGTRVVEVSGAYDNGEMLEAIKAMPEVALFGLLYSIYSAVDETGRHAAETTRTEWARAAAEKRIKVGRVKQGRRHVEIIPAPDPLAP
ncbi:hypothetical protein PAPPERLAPAPP_01240 [Brevundimonas phage vB_BpoS-Papperlapapp]|nr:hypothetical protein PAPPERLAPAPP_01240 [Brevundimonas phage vB_BpoS-Papperlapapp]